MKREKSDLRDRLEIFGMALFFMFYLTGGAVVSLFKKTENMVKQKIQQCRMVFQR